MEHLPTPLEPFYKLPKAPLLTRTVYENAASPDGLGKSFIGYPLQEGWTPRPADQWRSIFRSKDPQFLAFLQRWLYFGLSECVLGRTIPLSFFVEGGQYLSSRSLPQFADEIMDLRLDEEPDWGEVRAAFKHATHMHLALFDDHMVPVAPDNGLKEAVTLETFIDKTPAEDPRDPAMVTATSLLIDFFAELLGRKWTGIVEISIDNPRLQEPKTGPLWKTLVTNGWCPSEAAAIVERFNVSGGYYMCRIRAPNPLIHQQEQKCPHYKCNSRQLDDKTYQTLHISGCSRSDELITADVNILTSILVDRNTIPLICAMNSPWHDKQKVPGIVLEPWDGKTEFVAISHVWADGLGNPNANALPRCQMQRLSGMVQELTGRSDIPFWLDTICVPPGTAPKNMDPLLSKRQRQAHDQAIAKMHQTYAESSHVLVLDAWVISDACKAMGDVEKLIRIVCSGWNTRLWTYQEGALAKRLFFKLQDEIYDMDKGIRDSQSSKDWSFNCTFRGSLLVQCDNLRSFQHHRLDEVQRIKHLMDGLAFRTTSRASDETLCLSALMGFNVQDILNVKDPDPNTPKKLAEARMTKFWSFFTLVPAAIIKFDLPRLPIDGYNWAPLSLLLSEDRTVHSHRSFLMPTNEAASRTDRGLDIRLHGLEFRSNVPLGLEFYVKDEQQQLYHFYFKVSRFKEQAEKYTHNHSGNRREEICLSPPKAVGTNKLAFIFAPVSESRGDATSNLSHMSETGILVAIRRNQGDGHLEAWRLGFARLKNLQAPQDNDAQILCDFIQKSPQNKLDYEIHSLKYPNGTLLCTKGKNIPSQTWCVV